MTSAVTLCKVKAGRIQRQDKFIAKGIFGESQMRLSEVNQIDVNIISLTDGASIYTESIDFNSSLVTNGVFKYSYKIPKDEPGAVTSLKMDFTNKNYVIKAKNIDLTGLASPLELSFTLGSYILGGDANEAIINGSRKIIPTRLMRTYKDTLIVIKTKVANSDIDLSDSFAIKGDIAAEDINDSNLVDEPVTIAWDADNFTIPAGSFEVVTGNKYKCSKIEVAEGGLVTAIIDLDKCKFKAVVKNATLTETSGDVDFGISFASFDETDQITLP